jgi:hypothetical protein
MSTFAIPTKSPKKKVYEASEDQNLVESTKLTLMNAIEAAFKEETNLQISLEGWYPDFYSERTLDYWKKCNPAIAQGVREIFSELKSKGWNPHERLSRGTRTNVDYSGGGKYVVYAGCSKLHIECDFI